MTLNQKHTIETALTNARILLQSYNNVMMFQNMYNAENSLMLKQSFQNALDTLSQIDITEPQPYTEEILDLTTQIKDETNN